MKRIPVITILSLFACLNVSCGNDDDATVEEPQIIACRLVMASTPELEIIFEYNDNGQISNIEEIREDLIVEKRFFYTGNDVLILATANDNFYYEKELTLDNQGRIVEDYTQTNEEGSTWYRHLYQYSGDELTASVLSFHTGTDFEYEYFWSNGNLNTVTRDGIIDASYEYDLTQNAKPGDYFYLLDILEYGRIRIRSSNLVTNIVQGGDVIEALYTFDNDNNILSAQFQGGSGDVTLEYGYLCE